MLRQEDPEWRSVVIRSRRYLNNIVEQDHRAIKRRCAPMLALKSFRTAAVTLAGVELAHRFASASSHSDVAGRADFALLGTFGHVRWPATTLRPVGEMLLRPSTATAPELRYSRLTQAEIEAIKPVRYARMVWDGRGLSLLVTPKGSLCWRYAYRFAGKHKKLSSGTYPAITIAWARSRHEFARGLLASGVDPAALKATVGKQAFAAMMREWEIARGRLFGLGLPIRNNEKMPPTAFRTRACANNDQRFRI